MPTFTVHDKLPVGFFVVGLVGLLVGLVGLFVGLVGRLVGLVGLFVGLVGLPVGLFAAGLVGLPIYLLAGCEGFTRRDHARSKVRHPRCVGCRPKRRPNRWRTNRRRSDA